MLGKSSQKDLEIVKEAITSFWGDDCVVDSVDIINGPFPQFEIKMQLYNKANIVLEYDRGLLDGNLVIGGKRIILRNLTDKTIYEGFESMKPEIMQYNFTVLDEVARKHIAEQTL